MTYIFVQKVRSTHQSHHLQSELIPAEIATAAGSNHNKNTYVMDKSKPEGDACREDSTLKDASELDWPDSPTEYNRAIIEDQFRNNRSERTPTDEPDSNNSDSESMPKPQTTKKPPKKHLRQKLDTSSDDSDDLDSNGGDETDGSPEREEASSQPHVSDMFCYIWAPVDMATKGTKAENYRQLSRTRPRTFASAARTVKAPIQSKHVS